MVDRQPSFLVLKYLWLVLGSVIITASNSKLAGAYEADISGETTKQGISSVMSFVTYTDIPDSLEASIHLQLKACKKYDIGGDNVSRYKVDVYDRLWYPIYFSNVWNLTKLPDQSNIYIQSSGYKVPDEVMRAAATVDASSPLSLYFNPPADASGQLYIYFHFVELEELNDGQKRELRIELNGERNLTEPVILEYLKPVTINTTFPPINSNRVHFSIYAADDSDLPPILNAVEMYEIIELRRSPTNLEDGKHEGKNASILSWEDRMRIAVDTAQALENTHISKWVSSMLAGGDIRSIVDPKLSGDFEKNSAWKAVELALSCTSPSSSERPTMIEVVMELKECLALATAGNGEDHGNKTKDPRRMLTVDVIVDQFSPSAR
ncbi:hypothetical protein EZV62_028195 [Acer yangbiense]|uniref:Malectin-like domain-containing protein n=1 Tax=Acer yangbiense TaxID=1000413 RepID=A0A5C7GP68_9ROSI|nr:hypothetical protein EZV62_028195 [Acer yangbiense]